MNDDVVWVAFFLVVVETGSSTDSFKVQCTEASAASTLI